MARRSTVAVLLVAVLVLVLVLVLGCGAWAVRAFLREGGSSTRVGNTAPMDDNHPAVPPPWQRRVLPDDSRTSP